MTRRSKVDIDIRAATPAPRRRAGETSGSPPVIAQALEPVPLGEQAYIRLHREIVQCLLPPGVEITEAELASRYGLGKAPIRVALTRLAQDGLVRPVPRRGYLVAPITIGDVQDLFDMRALIEPVLCRNAVGRLDPATLRRMVVPPKVTQDPEIRGAYLEWNQRFHALFASGSGNRIGAQMLSDLLNRATRVTFLALYADDRVSEQMKLGRRESRQQHQDMIEAFARGDADEVERLVREHVETSRRLVLNALLNGRSTMLV